MFALRDTKFFCLFQKACPIPGVVLYIETRATEKDVLMSAESIYPRKLFIHVSLKCVYHQKTIGIVIRFDTYQAISCLKIQLQTS